jgi:hypothetical protein
MLSTESFNCSRIDEFVYCFSEAQLQDYRPESPLRMSSFSSVSIMPATLHPTLLEAADFRDMIAFDAELYNIDREPMDSWEEVTSDSVLGLIFDVACGPKAAAFKLIEGVKSFVSPAYERESLFGTGIHVVSSLVSETVETANR